MGAYHWRDQRFELFPEGIDEGRWDGRHEQLLKITISLTNPCLTGLVPVLRQRNTLTYPPDLLADVAQHIRDILDDQV